MFCSLNSLRTASTSKVSWKDYQYFIGEKTGVSHHYLPLLTPKENDVALYITLEHSFLINLKTYFFNSGGR